MKRKWEGIIGLAGAVFCLIFLGGFSLTLTTMEEKVFKNTVFPILQEGISEEYVSDSFEAIKALAAWFGTTLIIAIILVAVATFILWKNRKPKWAALFYTAAGAATLIGTQMIAFPLAFLFFVAAALCVFRKITEQRGDNHVPNQNRQSDFTGI